MPVNIMATDTLKRLLLLHRDDSFALIGLKEKVIRYRMYTYSNNRAKKYGRG